MNQVVERVRNVVHIAMPSCTTERTSLPDVYPAGTYTVPLRLPTTNSTGRRVHREVTRWPRVTPAPTVCAGLALNGDAMLIWPSPSFPGIPPQVQRRSL